MITFYLILKLGMLILVKTLALDENYKMVLILFFVFVLLFLLRFSYDTFLLFVVS